MPRVTPEETSELLARLDERTEFLVNSNNRILDQMASKAELHAAIAPVAKDLAEHKVQMEHRIDSVERSVAQDHQRLVWLTVVVAGVGAAALGLRQIVAWLSALGAG